ncbi:MAG TPA: DUF2071 domain-containing protein [Pirellulales bacterium]|nr:DUF2071 domain-containing protein [Pirellulales bacterium]
MATIVEEMDRAAPAERPGGRLAGYHHWHDLLFVHWRVEPDVVAPLLPRGVTLDTFDGSAWVGLVPFSISGLRPWWFPALPGVSAFNEINVRTYVHYRGRDPGVWFFSLDATNSLAVRVARWWWGLNYHRTAMNVRVTGAVAHYEAARRGGGRRAGAQLVAEIGPLLGADERDRPLPPGRTLPGTLEHFLLDRYILYSQAGDGPLYQGIVHHAPYVIHEASLLACRQTLLPANGIFGAPLPCHAAYCPGVEVEVFPLRRV